MSVTRFVRHNGVEIFEVDFKNLSPEKALAAIAEAKQAIVTRPKGSIRALTFVANSHFDSRVNEALREFTAHNKPYVVKSAVVGVTGVQQMLLSGIRILTGRDIRGFDDEQAAREWLASE